MKRLKKTVKRFGPGNQNKYGELNAGLRKQMKFQMAPHRLEIICKKYVYIFCLFIYLNGAFLTSVSSASIQTAIRFL
jgi:hypothetical protein